MGNGEAKELICMAHGHELRELSWGNDGGMGGAVWSRIKGGKWYNNNSTVSKIYFLKSGILTWIQYCSLHYRFYSDLPTFPINVLFLL